MCLVIIIMGNLNCSGYCTDKRATSIPCFSHTYPSIVIKTSTWMKDSGDLFDYQNHSIVRKNIKTVGTCINFNKS